MPKVSEICRQVRSKNAGPFWITLDLFFRDRASFDRYAEAPQFQPAAVGSLFDVDSGLVKRFVIPDLLALKLSYIRREAPWKETCTVDSNTHGCSTSR